MSALTPVEAVLGGVVLFAVSDPRIQAMAAESDREHFIQGCGTPWFYQLVAQALVAVGEASR